jgi:predicted nucleic acid-binding protein
MIVLDTNVISEAMKPEPHPAVRAWLNAARCYADLAVTAKSSGHGFPTPDGYIAAIATSRGFSVASRDTAPFEAARVPVINPWET